MRLYQKSTVSLHARKHKTGSRGLQLHNEREPGGKHSNPNIDDSRTGDNIILVGRDGKTYSERISEILSAGYKGKRAVRKDAVKMVEFTVQLGGDISTKGTEDDQVEVLLGAYEELKTMYGATNIVSAVIHLDESTPHLHFDFVPLTQSGKLSAKEVLGDKNKMRKTQADFLKAMQERSPRSHFDRKGEMDFHGLEQKLFERMTKSQVEKAAELHELDDRLENKEVELEIEREALEDKWLALANREEEVKNHEKVLMVRIGELNSANSNLKAREQALSQREQALAQREANYESKLVEVEKIKAEAQETLSEASKRLSEASERLSKVSVREKGLEARERRLEAITGYIRKIPLRIRTWFEKLREHEELREVVIETSSEVVEVVEHEEPNESTPEDPYSFEDALRDLEKQMEISEGDYMTAEDFDFVKEFDGLTL